MKVLVSDYDKTFYLNDLDIKKNIKTVREFQELGNLFIIATGRSYFDFKKKVNQYNIVYDYVFLNHGATILDKNDNVLFNIPIENTNIEKLKQDLQLEKSLEYFCCSELASRVDFTYPNLTKIAVRYLPFVSISKVKQKIENEYPYLNVYLVSTNMLEIISNNINKSKAISLLLNYLKIDKDGVYTIGDGETDIDMIKDYHGYAMTNSVKEIKKESIDEVESVYKLIKKII